MTPAFNPKAAGINQCSESHDFDKWHRDCLLTNILLAAAFGPKSLKKLLNKSGHPGTAKLNGQDLLLEAACRACRADQKVKTAVEKALNAKFQSAVGHVRKLEAGGILAEAESGRWQVPLLWGCCQSTDPRVQKAGRQLARRILLSGGIKPPVKNELDTARERAEALAAQNAALREELSEIKAENKRMAVSLQKLSARAAVPVKPVRPQANPHKKQARQLRRELAGARQEAETLRQQMAVWRSLALSNEKGGQSVSPANTGVEELSPADMCANCERSKADCACAGRGECPLSGRKVAVIGGLERLEKGYSQVIEKMGGKCIFHPGHTASGMGRLRKAVSGSDLVVYLTPINSHGAMSVVKKQCKRCNTPFCPLNGTSVSALESHLSEITDIFL